MEDGAGAYLLLAEKLGNDQALRGEAFNFSNELQLSVLDLTRRLLDVMDSRLEPLILDEVKHEIRHQYLSATGSAGRRLSASTKDWPEPSSGTGSSCTMPRSPDELRRQILDLVADYQSAAFAAPPFVPGETPIPVSGRVFDAEEIRSLVDSALDFWLTTGRFAREFERRFAKFFGIRHAILVQQLIELLVVDPMGSFDLPVQVRRPGAYVDVADI